MSACPLRLLVRHLCQFAFVTSLSLLISSSLFCPVPIFRLCSILYQLLLTAAASMVASLPIIFTTLKVSIESAAAILCHDCIRLQGTL